jgi:hypothetical protein
MVLVGTTPQTLEERRMQAGTNAARTRKTPKTVPFSEAPCDPLDGIFVEVRTSQHSADTAMSR